MANEFLKKMCYDDTLSYGIIFFKAKSVFGNDIFKTMTKKWLNNLTNDNCNTKPNNMHKYGTKYILDQADEQNILEKLETIVKYYYKKNDKKLYVVHDFMISYANNKNLQLDRHVDDSDITINICLKNTLINKTSTMLEFSEISNSLYSKHSFSSFYIRMKKGDILIHNGKCPHQTLKISDDDVGERINLIIWLKYI